MSDIPINMDLIREVGSLRGTAAALDGSKERTQALAEVAERLRALDGGSVPGFDEFIGWVRSIAVSIPAKEVDSASECAQALYNAVEPVEECLMDPNAAGALDKLRTAIEIIVAGIEASGGSLSGETGAPDLEGSGAAPGASGPETQDGADVLNGLASMLVMLDPTDRGQIKKLVKAVDAASKSEETEAYTAELEAISESLGRASRARKQANRESALAEAEVHLAQALDRLEDSTLAQSVEESPHPSPENPGPATTGDDVAAQSTDASEAEPGTDKEPSPGGPEEAADGAIRDGAATPLPADAPLELIADFVTESAEYLEAAEDALLSLESDPSDHEAINDVFRAFHTIKGVAGFLELKWIATFAHHVESLMSEVRDEAVVFEDTAAELTLRATDVMKELVHQLRAGVNGQTPVIPQGYAALLRVLADEALVERLKRGETIEVPQPVPAAGQKVSAGNRKTGDAGRSGDDSVRVKIDRLDSMVDLVGELVVAHSMLVSDPTVMADDGNLAVRADRLGKRLRELQDLSTSLRMVPLKPAFRKVARVVRDLGKKMGKPVELVTTGEDTEIDRTMVDVLADPLVHMARNSLDHGIESPEERRAAGKNGTGTMTLAAYQAGGNIVIEIKDDGRGIDRDRVLEKAIKQGLAESGRSMTDSEVFNLIFHPGFSTADKVTDVSGRGVGMDVVRRNVEALRGRTSIESDPGKGSTFTIQLPLTLAITDGLVVKVAGQVFIIPTVKIQMSLRPKPEMISTVHGRGELARIQNDLMPIVRLHRLYEIDGGTEELTEGILVIAGDGPRKTALLVDELVSQQQFVVKPIGPLSDGVPGVVGGAILGNGEVGLILDPEELIDLVRSRSNQAAQAEALATATA